MLIEPNALRPGFQWKMRQNNPIHQRAKNFSSLEKFRIMPAWKMANH
jgi:hypothetical protein